MESTQQSIEPPQEEPVFNEIESYPWSEDHEFQTGLTSILSSQSRASLSEEQTQHLILRARCFYFARKRGVHIDFAAYKAWREKRHGSSHALSTGVESIEKSKGESPTASGPNGASINVDDKSGALHTESEHSLDDPAAPYPITFSHIVELIASGQPIPGIKDIPDTVLEGQESRAIAGKRIKPWERQPLSADAQDRESPL